MMESSPPETTTKTRKSPDSLAALVSSEHRNENTDVLKFEAHRCSGYPTPRGDSFVSFIQYPTTKDLRERETARPIDVVRLSFTAGQVEQFKHDLKPDPTPVRSPSAVIFNKWRREIVMLEGCQGLSWGISDEADINDILLFIYWADDLAQAAGHPFVSNIPDELVKLLSKTPKKFHLRSSAGPVASSIDRHFEIVFFYCPTSSNDRRHFEYYYDAFTSTLRTGTINVPGKVGPHAGIMHLGSAGLSCGSSWDSEPFRHRDQNADVFVAFLRWQNEFARKQWYDDYSRMSYDELGWRIDGLKKMASLGVESHCLDLSQNDKETMILWQQLGFPEGGVEPRMTEYPEWLMKSLEETHASQGITSDDNTGEGH